jgi:hypothetical protein
MERAAKIAKKWTLKAVTSETAFEIEQAIRAELEPVTTLTGD